MCLLRMTNKAKEVKGERTNVELGMGDLQHFQYQVQFDLVKLFRDADTERNTSNSWASSTEQTWYGENEKKKKN